MVERTRCPQIDGHFLHWQCTGRWASYGCKCPTLNTSPYQPSTSPYTRPDKAHRKHFRALKPRGGKLGASNTIKQIRLFTNYNRRTPLGSEAFNFMSTWSANTFWRWPVMPMASNWLPPCSQPSMFGLVPSRCVFFFFLFFCHCCLLAASNGSSWMNQGTQTCISILWPDWLCDPSLCLPGYWNSLQLFLVRSTVANQCWGQSPWIQTAPPTPQGVRTGQPKL